MRRPIATQCVGGPHRRTTVDTRGFAIAVDHDVMAQISLYVRSAQVRPDYRRWLPSVSFLREWAGQVPILAMLAPSVKWRGPAG